MADSKTLTFLEHWSDCSLANYARMLRERIAKLEKKLAEAKQNYQTILEATDEYIAENKRLREALWKCLHVIEHNKTHWDLTDESAAMKAREALEEK